VLQPLLFVVEVLEEDLVEVVEVVRKMVVLVVEEED
jgi:hypothetical protein